MPSPFNVVAHFRRCIRAGQSFWLIGMAVAWALLVVGGFWLITDYELQPTPTVFPPAQWPPASQVRRSATTSTLIVFLSSPLSVQPGESGRVGTDR